MVSSEALTSLDIDLVSRHPVPIEAVVVDMYPGPRRLHVGDVSTPLSDVNLRRDYQILQNRLVDNRFIQGSIRNGRLPRC